MAGEDRSMESAQNLNAKDAKGRAIKLRNGRIKGRRSRTRSALYIAGGALAIGGIVTATIFSAGIIPVVAAAAVTTGTAVAGLFTGAAAVVGVPVLVTSIAASTAVTVGVARKVSNDIDYRARVEPALQARFLANDQSITAKPDLAPPLQEQQSFTANTEQSIPNATQEQIITELQNEIRELKEALKNLKNPQQAFSTASNIGQQRQTTLRPPKPTNSPGQARRSGNPFG